MRVLYTGPLAAGETCEMRRQALERLGHETVGVDSLAAVRRAGPVARRVQGRLRLGPMVRAYNAALESALAARPDVLWVDKGLFVSPRLLAAARRAGVRRLVHYSPDNYFLRQNASRHLWRGLPAYDLVVTTKAPHVARLRRAGARRVLLSGNAFDPALHRPRTLGADDAARFACDVSFIGRWEPERERLLARLAALPIHLAVRGPGWERVRTPALARATCGGPVVGDDYAKAIAGAKIGLGLLSRLAGDAITQRSIELPACGAFMLAERTPEHLAHFEEGTEAAYFDGVRELCAKVSHYLERADERRRVAAAGRRRCLASAYSYDARLAEILDHLRVAA